MAYTPAVRVELGRQGHRAELYAGRGSAPADRMDRPSPRGDREKRRRIAGLRPFQPRVTPTPYARGRFLAKHRPWRVGLRGLATVFVALAHR
jgi:hypothetical protein